MNFHKTILNKSFLFLAIPLMAMFTITACSDDTSVDPPPPAEDELNIVETAQEDGNFSILLQIAEDLGLAETLANDELTVFAPTDDAFGNLPDGILDELTDEQLTTILTYHLLEGTVSSGDIGSQQDAETLQGELLLLQREGDSVTINGFSSVVAADVTASNGVIHAVDEVLLPSEIRIALEQPNLIDFASQAEGFDVLLGAIEATGLTTTLQFLGPFTAFAPSDEAFDGVDVESLSEEQLAEILTYHVIDGEVASGDLEPTNTVASLQGDNLFITAEDGEVVINGSASVVLPDNDDPTNGTIHVIDEVLFPDSYGNVVENAVKRYQLTTLVSLVSDQGLVETLSDADAEYTVFAPTNEAFDAISEVLAGLSDEEVTNTLLYHVLDAVFLADDLGESQRVETLNAGEEILIEVADGIVTINGEAEVTVADVEGTNGVIHIIDAVLIPEELGGGAPDEEEVSASITIENQGSEAWVINEIDGDGASGETGEENTTLTLEEDLRFTVENLGSGGHPFQLRDSDGEVLIAAAENGELQDYEDANVVIEDDGRFITFTLTGELANRVATYNCEPHAAMEGDLTVG